MRDDSGYLQDILEAIQRIEKYAARGRSAFDSDELVQNWMIHHLQIIGEAIGKLSSELKTRHPEVPWNAIKAMRNILVHYYFGIDNEKVWKAVIIDVPTLKVQIGAVLTSLKGNSEK